MYPKTTAIAVALMLTAGGACNRSHAQEESVSTISVDAADDLTAGYADEEYRFRIDRPGSGWELMDEASIRNVVPDAVAGAVSSDGVWGVVIVESAPDAELDAFADLLIENMHLEEKEVELFERTTYQQKGAVRYIATGMVQGVPLRLGNMVFLHQGFAYQVAAWGSVSSVSKDGSDFRPFFDAFHLLDGRVRGRDDQRQPRDVRGVGWQLQDGNFDSVVGGVSIQPRGGWRVAVGAELFEMSADAEAGLVSSNPETYLVLILEREPGKDKEAFENFLYSGFTADLRAEELEEPFVGVVGGKKETFRRFGTESPPIEFLHTVHYGHGSAVQVLAWYMAGLRDQAEEALVDGLDSIRFLSPRKTRALAAKLSEGRDPENVVGAGFALRAGTYRSFQNGYMWKKPRGFWRVRAGQSARDVNPNTEVYFEEPLLGLYGVIVVEEVLGHDGAEYHELVVTDLVGEGSSPESILSGGTTWLITAGESDATGMRLAHRIATTVVGEKAVQLHTWGTPSSMEEHASSVREVMTGFRFVEGLAPTVETETRYTDQRFGFSFDHPVGWRRVDVTPPDFREAATYMSWHGPDETWMGVLAMTVLGAGQDEDWFLDLLERIARDRFGRVIPGEPEEVQTVLGGLPARHLAWEISTESLDAYLLTRDRTHYALLFAGSRSADYAAVKTSFRLFD